MKQCEHCGNEFEARMQKSRFCPAQQCRKVQYAQYRNQRSPESRQADQKRYRSRRFRERFESQLAKQGGHCALCPETEDLFFDHDHACCSTPNKRCGRCFRGVLCRKCNVRLHVLELPPDWIESAIEYLELYKLDRTSSSGV